MPARTDVPLSWTLSSFYGFYFAALGGIVPYLALYFESSGFSPRDIGLLMSVLMITKIIAPNFWGYFIDHFSDKYNWVQSKTTQVALFTCFGMFFLLNFAQHFWAILLCLFVFSFFWNAVLPQMESVVYNYLGERRHEYGKIRVWGSIGFILSVIIIGWMIESFGIQYLLPIISTLFLILALHGFFLKQLPNHNSVNETQGSFIHALNPQILLVLGLGMVTQMTHAPFYTFFSIYLEGYGYSKTVIGFLWAFGVIAEVGVFLFAHHLLIRFNIFKLLLCCFAITALRWWMLSEFPDDLFWLVLAQGLHAISFGFYHSTASQLINAHFKGKFQVRGQALYSSLTFGVGGAVGTLASGYLWTALGGQTVFLLCAIVMGIATVLGLIFNLFLRT